MTAEADLLLGKTEFCPLRAIEVKGACSKWVVGAGLAPAWAPARGAPTTEIEN